MKAEVTRRLLRKLNACEQADPQKSDQTHFCLGFLERKKKRRSRRRYAQESPNTTNTEDKQ